MVRRQAPAASTRTSSRGVWCISPPADGSSYSRDEVAALVPTSRRAVEHWIQDGVCGVRLRSLRVPRGRIAPADLCEFLSVVNEMKVEVKEEDLTRSRGAAEMNGNSSGECR